MSQKLFFITFFLFRFSIRKFFLHNFRRDQNENCFWKVKRFLSFSFSWVLVGVGEIFSRFQNSRAKLIFWKCVDFPNFPRQLFFASNFWNMRKVIITIFMRIFAKKNEWKIGGIFGLFSKTNWIYEWKFEGGFSKDSVFLIFHFRWII
jgi:hypothetical protein